MCVKRMLYCPGSGQYNTIYARLQLFEFNEVFIKILHNFNKSAIALTITIFRICCCYNIYYIETIFFFFAYWSFAVNDWKRIFIKRNTV